MFGLKSFDEVSQIYVVSIVGLGPAREGLNRCGRIHEFCSKVGFFLFVSVVDLGPQLRCYRVVRPQEMPMKPSNHKNDIRLNSTSTTGLLEFAECPKHSAKAIKHSANGSPSVTLGEQHSP